MDLSVFSTRGWDEIYFSRYFYLFGQLNSDIETSLSAWYEQVRKQGEELQQFISKQEQRRSDLHPDEEEQLSHLQMCSEDDHHRFGQEYPTLVRRALYLMVFGFVERMLRDICRLCDPIRAAGETQSSLSRWRWHLDELAGDECRFALFEENKLRLYTLVRDKFVHEFGDLRPKARRRLERILADNQFAHGIEVDESGDISLGVDFIPSFILEAEKLMEVLVARANSTRCQP